MESRRKSVVESMATTGQVLIGLTVIALAMCQALVGFIVFGYAHWPGPSLSSLWPHWLMAAAEWGRTAFAMGSPFVGFAIYCYMLRKCGLPFSGAAVLAGLISFAAYFLGAMGAAAVYGA